MNDINKSSKPNPDRAGKVVCVNARLTSGEVSDPEDVEVAGVYEILVRADVSIARLANAALDCFHESVAVSTLDDFVFEVFELETRKILEEDGDIASYRMGGAAQLLGKRSGQPLKRYAITLSARSGSETAEVGKICLMAASRREAEKLAFSQLWDDRLDATCCRPVWTVSEDLGAIKSAYTDRKLGDFFR